MADANRLAAALRYQQGMALPTPEPDSMVGRALDAAAQWGRGVQKNVSDLVSPTAWAESLKNPPRGVLSQMNPENKQEMINQGIDSALNFGPAMLGKIVYHGSPHKFDAFDMSKIGTGEGAQAYGHGLYFAEAPEVAKGYRDALQTTDTLLNGKKVFPIDPNFSAASSISANGYDTALAMARRGATEQFLTPEGRAHSAALAKQIEALKGAKIKNAPSGSLYKIDLPDEHIAKMLDWDKPLSQQSKEVRGVLQSMMTKARKSFPQIDANGDPIAGQIHHLYAQHRGGNAQVVADELKAAGIPGIRYLDQGSRAGGQGTSNYVVFEDQIPKIIGRE